MKRHVLLTILFVFFLLHFLKDITQDILHIATPLDLMGDIKEDTSHFPAIIQFFYSAIAMGSFFVELFILFAIPMVYKRKPYTDLEWWLIIAVVFMVMAFGLFALTDPTLSPFV